MKLERCDSEVAKELHTEIFPDDDWEDSTAHWVLTDGQNRVGFCSVQRLRYTPGAFLSRAGILPEERGKNLQSRMITTRLRWAKKLGLKYAVTYCTYENHPSIVNMLKSGFRFYVPKYEWGGDGVHYFWKPLTDVQISIEKAITPRTIGE